MKRTKLLLGMAALLAVIAIAVAAGSPYDPVMLPAPEDIEEIWAIEDARSESETPLVTALENHGLPLAYDAQENIFYCTLGMGNGETWPQLHITAPGAPGVRLMMVDDYSYDWCADAIRDGYTYQAIAYTDTEFAYFDLVFTGLTQLCIETDGQEIGSDTDTPIRVTMAAYGEAPLDTTARAHLRGASTLIFDKKSMKIEFTREREGGAKKMARIAPGFGEADDIALLPCWHDETKMRDKLDWDLWAELAADDEPFGARKTGYAEVFLNGAYHGLYILVEPVDVAQELALAGQERPMRDSVYRTAALNFSRDREYVKHPFRDNAGYELYHAPAGAGSREARFAALAPYIELTQIQDDAQFAARALELIDVDSALRHLLFVQGCGLADNVFNNMYVWARQTEDGVRYSFAPWDLDLAWGFEKESIGEEYENWMFFPVLDRMLNLDAGGIRQKAYDMWQEMRAGVFSEEKLEARIAQYTHLLGESGALMRDAWRWGNEMTYPDGYELTTFAQMRWPLIDRAMEEMIASDGPVDFLSRTQYQIKGDAIFPMEGFCGEDYDAAYDEFDDESDEEEWE